ncbi:Uncharacterised protein [Vibrio cholerae]|nr:Uncharacterised protein [Vibrio cholerae]
MKPQEPVFSWLIPFVLLCTQPQGSRFNSL